MVDDTALRCVHRSSSNHRCCSTGMYQVPGDSFLLLLCCLRLDEGINTLLEGTRTYH